MHRSPRTLFAWLSLAGLLGVLVGPALVLADAQTTWTAGPDAILDNTYDGYIDTPTANATVPAGLFRVSGWFVDKAAEGWSGADDVQVFQGTMDGGGKMLAKASIAINRPDVAGSLGNPFWANSGFSAQIPVDMLQPGAQTLSVYAHTPGKGWWYKQVPVNVSTSAVAAPAPAASGGVSAPVVSAAGATPPIIRIESPKPNDRISTRTASVEIVGYALDKNAGPNQGVQGSGIDRVQVYMDAERDNGGTYLGDATLGYQDQAPATAYGAQFQYAGWRVTFKPTAFHSGSHNLFAYGRSALSGKEDLATAGITISE